MVTPESGRCAGESGGAARDGKGRNIACVLKRVDASRSIRAGGREGSQGVPGLGLHGAVDRRGLPAQGPVCSTS